MTVQSPLWLASRSPRRKQMLDAAGFVVRVQPPDFDDSTLRPGKVSPYEWVTALACLKAWRVAELIRKSSDRPATSAGDQRDAALVGTVLGADTMCLMHDQALGQPRDADDAKRMLRLLRHATHETITGVCFISLATGNRIAFCDRAIVKVGPISDDQIEHYITRDDWRGKAGAYNLSEQIEAGWPIECIGDPATVMGLPMKRILERPR